MVDSNIQMSAKIYPYCLVCHLWDVVNKLLSSEHDADFPLLIDISSSRQLIVKSVKKFVRREVKTQGMLMRCEMAQSSRQATTSNSALRNSATVKICRTCSCCAWLSVTRRSVAWLTVEVVLDRIEKYELSGQPESYPVVFFF